MNKGVKIALGVGMTVGIGVIVYLMFLKKDSPIYVLKPKFDDDGDKTPSTPSGNNTQSSTSSTPSTTTPTTTTCPYPSTPFKNKTEGNKFREWVNDNHSAYARQIDLDRSGDYNNCYIRKAFAHKVSGRSLGNTYLATLNSEPESQTTDRDDFEYFIQRLKDLYIPYKITSSGCATIRLHNSSWDFADDYYQFAFCSNGQFAVAIFDGGYSFTEGKVFASGLYNLDSSKAGTRLTVTSGNAKNGDSLKGWSKTATNSNLWTMQELIQRYQQPDMDDSDAKNIKAIR